MKTMISLELLKKQAKNYTHSFHHICSVAWNKTGNVYSAIHAFNISNNIIPIKKQFILKMDCFFISVLCGLFYFCIFNDEIITLTKMKCYYFNHSYSKIFVWKQKHIFALRLKKHM